MAKKSGKNLDNKGEMLKATLSQIEKQFGKGSIMRLGQHKAIAHVEVIPTGILSIDHILGIGGFPRGRVVEIFGPESSGKTTLALHVIASAQQSGGTAAFIDAEHAFDAVYAKALGVDTENLLISQPDYGEQALEIAELLVRSSAIDVIVIDSVAALVPRTEIEGEMGDSHMGLQARLMSQALRKLTGAINKSKTCVIFINQLRSKIGVMFGNPETTTGGNALKFYASLRLDIRQMGSSQMKKDEQIIGHKVKIKVVKNKLAAPFTYTEVEMIYGKGISKVSSLLDLAVQYGIIDKLGTWYSIGDERLGQGKSNAQVYLLEHPDLYKKIEIEVRKKLGFSYDSQSSEKEKKDTDKLSNEG